MKMLEFNGANILYTYIDGVYWIALKPICEALSVNYNRQFQNLKARPVFGAAFAKQQMQVPDDQACQMVCLPEELSYDK